MQAARHEGLARIAGWIAFGGWLVWRCIPSPALELATVRSVLTYFYLDASFVLLALAVALFARSHISARSGWIAIGALAAVSFSQFYVRAASRYYSGASLAFDLANYIQPMWRAAHGLTMDSATYDARPIWADHGSFAMFLFAPFTRLADNAPLGLFLVQSTLAAASIVAAFGLALALGLPAYAALGAAAVLASSRALAAAASFDFHPECAFGLLLFGIAWTRERQQLWAAAALTLLAASLRDMTAFTIGMLWVYWALRDRARLVPAGLAVLCLSIAAIDIFALPRWTGWPSYAAMNASSPIDFGLSVETTLLRGLSSFGIGWLHPIAWVAGAPWIAAAAVSPKLLVKGIDFQYGFLFVPVALLGALQVFAWISSRAPTRLAVVVCVWVVFAVSVNAPARASLTKLMAAHSRFEATQRELAQLAPASARVAADACAAPYVIEREHLTLLCRLDTEHLQRTGGERWEYPVDQALQATHLVVRQDCRSNGPCAAAQVERAQVMGFRVVGKVAPFVVLARPSPGMDVARDRAGGYTRVP